MRLAIALLAPTLVGLAAGPAAAHDLYGQLSDRGVEFVEEQLPSYVPTRVQPPAIEQTLFTCPGGRPVTANQHDTNVDLSVHALDLSIPRPGTLRVDLTFSVAADGKVYLKNPFVCYGETTCSDSLTIDHARAVLDFDVSLAPTGKPQVDLGNVDLQVGAEQLDFHLADCSVDDVVNFVIDFAKNWFLDYLLDKLEGIAKDNVGPALEGLLGGFTQYSGSVGIAEFSADITQLGLHTDGLHVRADVDVTSQLTANACIGDDPGDPTSHAGSAPDLSDNPNHLALAINLGLVDDALYHIWRYGLTCLTDEHLKALGVEVPLDQVAAVLPNVAPGTKLGIAANFTNPPRVEGSAGADATLTIVVDGLELTLTGTPPVGEAFSLEASVDARATARVAIDPVLNALVLEVISVDLERLKIDDQMGATRLGFDVARLQQIASESLVPALIGELGKMPVTGPVFSFADYHLILRELSTTDSHLVTRADLFRAPADDRNAPNTILARMPTGPVNPKDAVIEVSGVDAEVPEELLRFRATIDGVAGEPGHVRRISIGRAGVTATYQVQVAAVDLAGNTDPSPVALELTVDGIAPHVVVLGERIRDARGIASLSWRASDDLSADLDMRTRVELFRLDDPTDILDVTSMGVAEVPPGQSSADIPLDDGALYRVDIVVVDEAGNEGRTSVLVSTGEQASGGCRASHGDAGSAWMLLVLAGLVCVRRRRR
jgi:hypothetical protein